MLCLGTPPPCRALASDQRSPYSSIVHKRRESAREREADVADCLVFSMDTVVSVHSSFEYLIEHAETNYLDELLHDVEFVNDVSSKPFGSETNVELRLATLRFFCGVTGHV